MILKKFLFLTGGVILPLFAAEPVNLFPPGNFEATPAVLRKNIRSTGDGWVVFKEMPGRNHCAEIRIKKISKQKDGTSGVAAAMRITVAGLIPRQVYRIRFDISGTASSMLFLIHEKGGPDLKYETVNKRKKGGISHAVPVDWGEYIMEFSPRKSGICTFEFSLWHNTRYGKMFYSPGDYVLIDNIAISPVNKK